MKKMLMVAGCVAVTLLAGVVTYFACHTLLPRGQASKQSSSGWVDLSALKQARQSSVRTHDDRLIKQLLDLKTRGLITSTTPAFRYALDSCIVSSYGPGWSLEGYRQDCTMRFIEGYPSQVASADTARDILINVGVKTAKEEAAKATGWDRCFIQVYAGALSDDSKLPYERHNNIYVVSGQDLATNSGCALSEKTSVGGDDDPQVAAKTWVSEPFKGKSGVNYVVIESELDYSTSTLSCNTVGVNCMKEAEKAITDF